MRRWGLMDSTRWAAAAMLSAAAAVLLGCAGETSPPGPTDVD